jgi:hypothetical protein
MRLIRLAWAVLVVLTVAPRSRADVAVLLEEPYSYDGALAGTGHAAVYLTRVCAVSPTVLRRCQPGEAGVVLSRYHHIAGYDWIAVPLIPYLYAVEKPEHIPLFTDSTLEAALRDRYRRKFLEGVAPDGRSGETPGGDWYELVGSAYDRTLYGFQIETSAAQDDKFIAQYNSRPNRDSYKVVSRNCADFVSDVVNFYYPKALRRSFIADLAVSTPKHAAKAMVQFSKKNPELQFTAFVVPQVPGTIRRSRPVRGIVESVFKAKKYELPLLALHPVVAGGVAVAYVAGGRFSPPQNALVFTPEGGLQTRLSAQERRAYLKGLEEVTRTLAHAEPRREEASWHHLLDGAQLRVDESGCPILQVRSGDTFAEVGITRENVLTSDAPPEVMQELLVARLREQLRGGRSAKTSEPELRLDWKLMQAAFSENSNETVAHRKAATDRETLEGLMLP